VVSVIAIEEGILSKVPIGGYLNIGKWQRSRSPGALVISGLRESSSHHPRLRGADPHNTRLGARHTALVRLWRGLKRSHGGTVRLDLLVRSIGPVSF
jgi:hypothetical protein